MDCDEALKGHYDTDIEKKKIGLISWSEVEMLIKQRKK